MKAKHVGWWYDIKSHVKDHQQNQHTMELPSGLTIFSLGFDWYSDIAGANYFVRLTLKIHAVVSLLSFNAPSTSILEMKRKIVIFDNS